MAGQQEKERCKNARASRALPDAALTLLLGVGF